MQRDLFGRQWAISRKEITDIKKLFSYPMTPIPTSLCDLDGCKTDKATRMNILRNDSVLPTHIDVVIVNVFFFNSLHEKCAKSLGNISKKN